MSNIITYKSTSGYVHQFQAHPKRSAWPSAGGVYLFVKQRVLGSNDWTAVYVGQTQSFAERLPTHERWSEAERRGATHVAICIYPNALMRGLLEQELIRRLDPPMNEMLRGSPPLGFVF